MKWRLDKPGWIQTYTGRQFWPLSPRPEDLDIDDIAHALSNVGRYGGHAIRFYSVAQHCVHASMFFADPALALCALMHDSSEAYLVDMPKPVKEGLPEYRQAEERLMQTIASHFRFPWPEPKAVKDIDRALLITEYRDLMRVNTMPAEYSRGVEPLHLKIIPWSPSSAKAAFLYRYETLRRL